MWQVVAYFAPQFAEVRRRWVAGGEAAYVASLSRCRKWDSSGGKSNAYFAKTRDERFIVKQLSRSEKGSLLNTAPAHFAYLSRRRERTCLAKILGVYQVGHITHHTQLASQTALKHGRTYISSPFSSSSALDCMPLCMSFVSEGTLIANLWRGRWLLMALESPLETGGNRQWRPLSTMRMLWCV